MKKTLLIAIMATVVVSLFSCKKTDYRPDAITATEGRVDIEGCTPTTVSLIAGQTINSGSVTVNNDANFIYVTYTTAYGYLLTQTHLYVGDCALVPVNNSGNPQPGQFPYAANHNYITTYTYQVPISAIPAGSCGSIAAHAVVVKLNASGQVIEQQTGWGNGVRINPNGGNWGMKFDFCSCSINP